MYIYDTGEGYNIIVEELTDIYAKSHLDIEPEKSKVSILRWDGNEEPYFNRCGNKVYLKDLGPEYIVY